MKVLIRLITPYLGRYVIVTSGSESGKVKLFTVSSVNLRILGMSSIPPSLKASVMLLFSRMTSVTWTKAAFEAGWKLDRHGGATWVKIKIKKETRKTTKSKE